MADDQLLFGVFITAYAKAMQRGSHKSKKTHANNYSQHSQYERNVEKAGYIVTFTALRNVVPYGKVANIANCNKCLLYHICAAQINLVQIITTHDTFSPVSVSGDH